MLLAAGRRALAVGNVGRSIVEAIDSREPYEVLALELSSFQLHRSHLMRPFASAVLNIAPDHLDWHGDFAAYCADKARILERTTNACIYRTEEPITRELIEQADVEDGCRAIGTTLGVPALGEIGVVDGLIVDRAYEDNRRKQATELAGVDDLVDQATHTIANALSAAALVRSTGVGPSAIRQGLHDWKPQPHRMTVVATIDQVTWVDDSKATNPHAAAASLASFDDIVWIAGGLAKGAEFDELVTRAASRLRAVIVLGTDRGQVVAAVKRHAPDVPVIDVDDAENGAVNLMQAVVEAARRHAVPGSTVLLAPACASMDRFRDYHERGQLFAEIVVRNQS
jgi:UDP-N-acetylmuramoylalanine--D-glutamate ligase